jgi:hypothetical protein
MNVRNYLETERLKMRRWEESDSEDLFRYELLKKHRKP